MKKITLIMMSICFSYTVIYSVNVDSPSQQIDEAVNESAPEQGQLLDNPVLVQERDRVVEAVYTQRPASETMFNENLVRDYHLTRSMIEDLLQDENLGAYPVLSTFVIGERSQELPMPGEEDDVSGNSDDDLDEDADLLRELKRRRVGS